MPMRPRPGRVRDWIRRLSSTKVRSWKYLINLIDEYHRNIKSRTIVKLAVRQYRSVAITISGIELIHRICKGAISLAWLDFKDITAPTVRNAAS
jgi:putative transposase